MSKRILSLFAAVMLAGALNVGAQAIDSFPRTTTIQPSDLLLTQTNSIGAAGQKFTRSITWSNVLESLMDFSNWTGGSGSGTSGIFTNVIYVNANGASQAANGALLTNAFESDLQGVRIIVGPGDYYVGEFAVPSPAFSQDNRIIEFQPGSNIRAGSTSSAAFFIFDDSAGKRTNVHVVGRANFFQTNAPGGSGALLSLENGSTVYFEHQSCYLTNADSTFTMGGVGNNTLTLLTHGRASTWTYDNAFFNGTMTNRLYAFQNEIETVGDILEVSGNAAAWGDVVFGYNKAWARNGLSGQASIMQIGGRVTVKNGVLTVERTNASIFSTSATTNGLIEGGMILMPPNGRRSVLEDNSQGTGDPFNGQTALWLKNIYIRGATNVDAFSLTNGTVNETILENVRLDPGWASTNAIRATTPSKVRIVGNLEVHPYKPFGTGITVVGTNATSAIRNVGTLVNHGAAHFSNLVQVAGAITSGADISAQNFVAAGDVDAVNVNASGAIGTAALNLGNPTPSSLLMVNGNGDATNVTLGSNLSLSGTTLNATGGSSSGSSNSIPVVTIITNVNIGFGTRQSLAMTTPSNQFVNFQGTETNGDTVELAVTNTAATNITITFNLDGTTSSYYDPTAGTNRSSFVVSPGGKILTFVYSTNWGAIWRLNAYLGLELEIAPGTNITFTTNGALVTIASSASGGGVGSFAANANQFDTNNGFSLKRQANLTNPIVWGVISETNWINVRAYGAVGDGVTDDATAFKAAFTNPLVYVPAGRYLIGSAMAKTNGIVRGDGPARTVLLQNFNGILINTITPAQRVSFYDMEFDGQGGSDYSGGGAIGSRYAVQAYGMGLNNFERLHFRNYSGDALYIDSVVSTDTSRDSVVGVFNCYFSNCWSGISLKTSEYARVIGNAIDECSYGLVLGAANAHVSANRIIDCYQGVNVSQIFSSVRGHNMLVGNSMNHCTYPLVAKGATGMTVTGNELMGNGTVWFTNASGINFIGNLCELNGFRFEGGAYNAVKNNTFYSGTTPTFTHNYAGATSYTRVEGNANELGASVPVSPTLTLAAGAWVTNATDKVRVVGSGGAVTLTSTPSVNTNSIPDGTVIRILGTDDTNTITVQDEGTLTGSKCELGATTRALGLGDALILQYDHTLNKWFEIGFFNN